MRICVLTGNSSGGAAAALDAMSNIENAELACVILATGQPPKTLRYYKRRLLKVLKIGILGAINGRRLRKWFRHSERKDLRHEAKRLGILLYEVPYINHDKTIEILKSQSIELGVSLGNGFIASRVFSTPPNGMINYHGERLPDYPGAQSILWPIFFNQVETGFTIHKISNIIDGGEILYRRKFRIYFCHKLEDTVRETGKIVHPRMPAAISHVIKNFDELSKFATLNDSKRHFTTPTFWQFLRMRRNNSRLYRTQMIGGVSAPSKTVEDKSG